MYVRGRVERLTRLVGGFTADVNGTWQVSDANLLASEQLGLGGFQSIRGFHESLLTRDNGVIVNVELQDRPRKVAGRNQLVLFIFTDIGAGSQHHTVDGEASHLRLWSAGPGLRYRFGRHLDARLSYGFVITHTGLSDAPRGELHFGVRTSY